MKPRALRDLRTDSREMRAPSSKNHGSEAQRQGYGTGSVLASYPGYARERDTGKRRSVCRHVCTSIVLSCTRDHLCTLAGRDK
jgi:hypothetical protein